MTNLSPEQTAKTLAKNAKLLGYSTESDNEYSVSFAWALSNPAVIARFWSYVQRSDDGCWLWTSNCTGHGSINRPENSKHGQFTYTFKGKQHHVYAHRFAYALVHGVIPPDIYILHRCDVPPCCNERHLFPGNTDINLKDAAAKNRLTVPRTRLLSLSDRLDIYCADGYRGIGVDLARRYAVTEGCISLIRRGRFIGSGVWSGTKESA